MAYKPPYTLTPHILALVARISESLAHHLYAHEDLRLHRINRIKTIRGTLAIEGNGLSGEQITALLEGRPVVAPADEVQEVKNALRAYSLLEELDPCRAEDLLRAHAQMEQGLIEDAGSYRTGSAGVVSGQRLIHLAPDAGRVPCLVGELLDWLATTDEHPLVVGAVFHYEFEFIHPFSDGNGRMGRLWQTLIMSRWRPIFRDLPIENIVYNHQQAYYRALAQSGGAQGCTPFIEFMLEMIAETLRLHPTAQLPPREAILSAIRRNPRISRSELACEIGISVDGVKYHLQNLARTGRLRRVGAPRQGYWEILDI